MTLTIENTTDDRLNTDIAVIGMSGRFPLAKNLEEFWENLKNGKDCIAKVPESRLSDLRAFSGNESVHFPDLGYLDDISRFDANFFGIPEEESPFIDPSQRLLLEVVYEAFESGGYGGSKMANTRTGVFIASSNSNYRLFFYRGDSSRLSEPGLIPAIGAGRISHVFDLRGPSLMIDTACSSTLAALHVACESLRRNECAMALVGAINIYALLGGNEEVSSSFNRCRVFDHLAGEIVGGEGMGAILLKPLHMALKDQDIIFAVIKGTAINQNGGRPPTVSGQSIEALCDVMQQAWDNARITPDTLSYIEASGAANPIGDVFEVKSITDAFAKYTNKKECCSIGSVKTNIGHLNHASGMASLLKVILAMNHKHVPPLIHLEKPNPYIDFQNSPVFIDTRLREWETIENRPMRAGVSSFSMSGTNCHAVIEAPPPRPYPAESYGEHSNIITISAKSKTSLAKLCQAIKDYISNNPHEDIHDICFTQNTGRGQYEYRLALVFKGKNRLIEHLTNASFLEDKANVNGGEIFFRTDVKRASREESSAVFLFSDCSAMPERIFRNFLGKGFLAEAYMNECLTILPMETSSRVLSFAFQYALARLWMDAGIRPAFVLGFGIGKYVSKVISGSMKLDEALSLCGSDNGKENTFNKDKVIENIQVMYAKKGQKVYLEIGPGNILGQITRQTLERYGDCHVLDSYGRDDDEKMLLESIARLYIGGIPIDFSSLFPGQRLVLPVYPFEGKRYWVNVRPAFLDGPSESGGRGKPAQLPETLPMALKPRPDINVAYTAPRTEIEQALSEIFRNFFHIETVGIYDDFFKLGGDSLKAVSLISLIHRALNVDVPLTEFFSNPNIQGLAEIIERMEKNIFVSIEPVEEREYYILSSAQKRLYVLQHMVVDNISYNMPSVIPLSENIEKEKLESVFKRLIQRHESLRTSFITIGEEPVQRIYDKVDFSIGWYETTEEEAERLISGFTRPFDLSVAPLLRVNHVGIGSSSRVLVIDMHHIITDGVSQEILGKEFDALYSGKGELSPLHLQYKDYAVWQNSEIQHTRIKEQENYWLNRFSDEIPVLELPTDYPRPVLQSFQGGTVEFGFSSEETAALKRLATELGVTPYMLILSVLTILLSRLSGQDDIVVGTAIAGRRHADLEQIIGMFVNTLALRYFPRGAMDYKEFIEELKSHTLGAYDHPDYPFEDLVDHLSVIRDIGRNPVFDVMYNFLSREDRVIKTDRGPVESNHRKGTSKFDLTLTALDYGDRLFFTFDYCTKLFVSKTIDRFISYFKRLMGQVLENPDQKVSQLEIIGEEEKKLILHEFNDTRADYPKEKTIHGLFEAQAIKTPDHLAVIGSTGSMVEALHATPLQITYRELNERSGQLAYRLMREGVQADIIVGIKTERSIEMIIGILGILTSGGAYLPIDPDYPQDRIDYILKDSGATVLVTTHEEGQKVRSWEGKQVLFLDSLNLSSSHPLNFSPIFSPLPATAHRPLATSLAYIIYTSGTTGRPKGVLVEHRNVINVVNWFAETHKIGMGTRILQISDFTFDASVNQIFGALISGAAFYIVSADIRLDIEKMRHYIMKHAIHLINFVPSYLRELLCYVDKLENLHTVLSGADRLDDATKDTLIGRGYRLVNQYGPTETTIDALAQECSSEKVNLGKPIANVRVYIWDKYGNVLPIGITGELYIGGAGVSRGYLNNPELTSEKFIRCRLPVPGSRFYKTGDLARWLANGTIEFLGRMDDQVKIRGFRIELGEIEAHLSRHSGIKEAVVIAGNGRGGDKLLCAYVVFEKGHEDSRIKDYLTEELPDYMIPAHFITLDQIPLTPNGKVDRKALPKPGLKSGYRYIAPRNKIENELVNMWSEVLGVDLAVIGIDSNFFELGGHSLKAMALVSKIHKTFDIQMPLAEVLRAPRIRDLAEYIQSKDKEAYSAIEPIEEKEYYELSSAQKRLYVLHHMTVGNIGYNLPHIIPLPEEMEKEKLESVFKQLIQRHESLRTSFTTIDEEPVQRVHDGVDFSIGWYETTEAEAEQLISGFTRPFDLSVAPLLRVNHVGIGSSSRVLVIDMHHIITDGVSQEILKKEFDSLYSGKGELSPLHLQYKDYAEWQNSEIQHTRIQAQENYWLNLFSDEIPVLELPTDYPRPVLQSFEGGTVEFGFSSGETAALKRLATELGVTPYMLILSVLTILLSRLSGQDDIVVGTAIAGRRHADLEQIIGMFVNTLALRNFPRGAMDYKEFLEELKSHTWGAYDHPDYPFEDLVDQLSVTRDIGRNPVFDVMYNFLSREDRVIKTDRGPVELNHRKGTSKFDLTLTALDYGDRLFFTFDYCTKLFVSKTIDRFISYFKRLMGQVLENPDQKLSQMEIIGEEEKGLILNEFNDTRADYPRGKTIHDLFEEQAVKTPDQLALLGPTSVGMFREAPLQISYRELNEQSNHLSWILKEVGIEPDTIVAIKIERSIEMIIGILGILKSGGAYLPIDPDYPQDRIDYILKDSGVTVLVTTSNEEVEKLRTREGKTVLFLDSLNLSSSHPLNFSTIFSPLPAAGNRPPDASLAYVIYTSGSTGKPKGAVVEMKGFVNLLHWYIGELNLTETDNVLLIAPVSFDLAQKNLFASLIMGGRLTLGRPGILNYNELSESVCKGNVTIVNCAPSVFYPLIEFNFDQEFVKLQSLRVVVLGGEPILTDKLWPWVNAEGYHCEIFNTYGPTECTDIATFHRTHREFMAERGAIPIGKCIPNVKVFILDKYYHIQPIRVSGEIVIGGIGVSQGYLNRPELTSDKFIGYRLPVGRLLNLSPINRFCPAFYHTGDLGRWLEDGNIEFLGRIDHQVKIRGFRIEMGEIESRLLSMPGVKDAVVLANDDDRGDKYLCAYLVSDRKLEISEMREFLARLLPAYMVPAYFLELEKIPLSPNGKVDRKALPKPGIAIGQNYVAPRNETEEKLVELWSTILNIEKDVISIDSNFFELGGHSLKATILLTRIEKMFDVKIPLSEVFNTPTIQCLSSCISAFHAIRIQPSNSISEKKEELFL